MSGIIKYDLTENLPLFIISDIDNHKIKNVNKIKKHNHNIDNQNNILHFLNNLEKSEW